MKRQHCYLLVEGQQDLLFLGRLLESVGCHAMAVVDDIPQRWQPFIDEAMRERDRKLRQRGEAGLPMWQLFKPACLANDSHVVIVESAGGNRVKFQKMLLGTDRLLEGGLAGLSAVGLLPDADTDPGASLASARDALQSAGLAAPTHDGEVLAGSPQTGIFTLPGGAMTGGLEQLLVDCAATVYPDLLTGARTFVEGVRVDDDMYIDEDMHEMKTPQGPLKAVIGCISSVLKPGSTIQVSILRDRWVSEPSLAMRRAAALLQFLKDLCGIP